MNSQLINHQVKVLEVLDKAIKYLPQNPVVFNTFITESRINKEALQNAYFLLLSDAQLDKAKCLIEHEHIDIKERDDHFLFTSIKNENLMCLKYYFETNHFPKNKAIDLAIHFESFKVLKFLVLNLEINFSTNNLKKIQIKNEILYEKVVECISQKNEKKLLENSLTHSNNHAKKLKI
jgi:hypothetical protein